MKRFMILFFVSVLLSGCKRENKELQFSEDISPLYFLDMIHLDTPVTVYVDSCYYIAERESLNDIINRKNGYDKKILRYLTPEEEHYRYTGYIDVYSSRDKVWNIVSVIDRNLSDVYFYLDLVLSDAQQLNDDVTVYEFKYNPESFYLTAIADEFIEDDDDYNRYVTYSFDYTLAAFPVFSKRDLKKIREEGTERLNNIETVELNDSLPVVGLQVFIE